MAIVEMSPSPVLQMVDAVTVPVPDLDHGLAFYRDRLGHGLIRRMPLGPRT
jgi:catechol 2,3-dioxygenase-like lactoylglutathione lyase family enzyme